MNLDAPETAPVHLCIFQLLFRTVPAIAELPSYYSLHSTRTLCRITIPEKQDTAHKQWPATVHSNSAPDKIIEVTIWFRLKRYSPEVKAIYLPWFQQSPEGIQGSLHLYKAPLASVFSRLHFSRLLITRFSVWFSTFCVPKYLHTHFSLILFAIKDNKKVRSVSWHYSKSNHVHLFYIWKVGFLFEFKYSQVSLIKKKNLSSLLSKIK